MAKPSAALQRWFSALFFRSGYEIALITETDCLAGKQRAPDTREFKPTRIEGAGLVCNLCASGFVFIDLD